MNAFDKSQQTRRVRLFRNGRSQAVRIPKEWEIDAQEVEISLLQDGSMRIARPKKRTLQEYFEWAKTQPPLGPEDQFPEIEDLPPEPVDL